MAVIRINAQLGIEESEISFDFIRASGPGGQKVNKSSTAVQLRFDVLHSPSLPEDVRCRLAALAGKRLSEEGILIIQARRFRSQDRNRQDAVDRLAALVRRAAHEPRRRRPSRPGAAARERRLQEKKQRSTLKKQRTRRDFPEDS